MSPNVLHVAGARWGAVSAGIKSGHDKLDLALLELVPTATVAAVFTRNAFCAAPVHIAKAHLLQLQNPAQSTPVYCLINAGNANAGTGEAGLAACRASCELLSEQLGCDSGQILPFSTGVIGELLPVEKISASVSSLVDSLSANDWQSAAEAIMTTDTVAKVFSRVVDIDGRQLTISGIAKGAGMIKPNMATMLAYIVTDAKVAQSDLDKLLDAAVNQSFNRITVDGDTSTNDACLLAATGESGVEISPGTEVWGVFQAALNSLMQELATAIIRDAEGATKFITINVNGGGNVQECLQVGYAIAESPLVKTAFFASDANWGRILAAVGRAGIDNLDVSKVEILLDDYCICARGERALGYEEEKASAIMSQKDITITINLNRGDCAETIWTSDLSHDYVRINAEYRT